jgi:uncharacterized protein YkwD
VLFRPHRTTLKFENVTEIKSLIVARQNNRDKPKRLATSFICRAYKIQSSNPSIMTTQIAPIMMLPTDIHLSGRGRSFARRCHAFDNNKKQPQPSCTRTKKESSSRRRIQMAPANDDTRYTLRQRYEVSKSNSRTPVVLLQEPPRRKSCNKSIQESKEQPPNMRQVTTIAATSTASTDSTRRHDPEPSSTTVDQQQQRDPPQGSFLRPSRKVITTTPRRHTMASRVVRTTTSVPSANLPVRERTVVNRYPIDPQGQTLPVVTFQPTTKPRRHTLGANNEECCGHGIHDTWYFSSNHVLVNRERVERGIPALRRSIRLDELARDQAQQLAEARVLVVTAVTSMKSAAATPSILPGNNTFRGQSIRQIHQDTMCREETCIERENILNADFNEFGMATKKGTDGLLYLVQFFDTTAAAPIINMDTTTRRIEI